MSLSLCGFEGQPREVANFGAQQHIIRSVGLSEAFADFQDLSSNVNALNQLRRLPHGNTQINQQEPQKLDKKH